TVSTDISSLNLSTLAGETMTVAVGPSTLTTAATLVALSAAPASLTDLAAILQSQLQHLGAPPAIPTATVALIPGTGSTVRLQISAVTADPSATLTFAGSLATSLGLDAAGTVTNVPQYALGATTAGTDGTVPNAPGLIGDPLAKTGLYALDPVDIFNILCLP